MLCHLLRFAFAPPPIVWSPSRVRYGVYENLFRKGFKDYQIRKAGNQSATNPNLSRKSFHVAELCWVRLQGLEYFANCVQESLPPIRRRGLRTKQPRGESRLSRNGVA
jgi:hypothetical protein